MKNINHFGYRVNPLFRLFPLTLLIPLHFDRDLSLALYRALIDLEAAA